MYQPDEANPRHNSNLRSQRVFTCRALDVPLHHPTAEVLSDNDRPRSTRLSNSAQVQSRAIIRCLKRYVAHKLYPYLVETGLDNRWKQSPIGLFSNYCAKGPRALARRDLDYILDYNSCPLEPSAAVPHRHRCCSSHMPSSAAVPPDGLDLIISAAL